MNPSERVHVDERFRLLPLLHAHRCIVCGWCVVICPTNCLETQDGLPEIVRPADCTFCGVCAAVCPTQALEMPTLPCPSLEQSSRPADAQQ